MFNIYYTELISIGLKDRRTQFTSLLVKQYVLGAFFLRGGVAQWVAPLTRDRWIPVSCEFEPHQRPPLFP